MNDNNQMEIEELEDLVKQNLEFRLDRDEDQYEEEEEDEYFEDNPNLKEKQNIISKSTICSSLSISFFLLFLY
jgi:hypothetical protein